MLQFRIKHQIPQFKKIPEVSWNKVPAFENSWHVQLRYEGAMRNGEGGVNAMFSFRGNIKFIVQLGEEQFNNNEQIKV